MTYAACMHLTGLTVMRALSHGCPVFLAMVFLFLDNYVTHQEFSAERKQRERAEKRVA
jgi:hypothetical protein